MHGPGVWDIYWFLDQALHRAAIEAGAARCALDPARGLVKHAWLGCRYWCLLVPLRYYCRL
jgi:hypothetical protein